MREFDYEAIKGRIQKDVPKADIRNLNTGRFFSDLETAVDSTGIDIRLIQKLKIILEAIVLQVDCRIV